MKQRVVGAIVLVALAVIFLPMLLDGSGRPEQVDLPVEIPEEPPAPESRLDSDSTAATTKESGEVAATALDSGDSGVPANGGGTQERQEEAVSGGESARESSGQGSSGQATGASAGDETAGSTVAGEAEPDEAAGTGAWAVQVGSFARETNALVLRDRLRQQGYEAFTEQVSSDGRALWRVRIGPVSSRERAESLEAELEEQRGSDALVTSYP